MHRTALLRNDTIRWLVTILAIFLVLRALESLSRPALGPAPSLPGNESTPAPGDALIDAGAQGNWRELLSVRRQS